MFKKFVMLALALGVGFGAVASAQEAPQFTITSPAGKVETLKGDFSKDFRDVAELTQAEFEGLLAQNHCGDQITSPTACAAWSGRFCTGTRTVVPCGFGANGTYRSLQFGCVRTLAASGVNLTGTVVQFTGFPQDICITPTVTTTVYRSFACLN